MHFSIIQNYFDLNDLFAVRLEQKIISQNIKIIFENGKSIFLNQNHFPLSGVTVCLFEVIRQTLSITRNQFIKSKSGKSQLGNMVVNLETSLLTWKQHF